MTTRVRFAIWAAAAGALAVLLAGVVAIVVVERSLHQVVDDRIGSSLERMQAARTTDAACAQAAALADDPRGRVAAVIVDSSERCRSSLSAPSPRALGVSLDAVGLMGIRSRRVDGTSWRVGVVPLSSGGFAIVGEQDESVDRALRNAQRAIAVAIAVGILLAIASGVLASMPATRRIRTLLDRIRGSVRPGGATTPIAGGLGRDLDAAARSVDELLEQLRASEEARRRLFADAAHQLRTPVTSIRTNAQLLERRDDIDADTRDIAGRMAAQTAAIGELVSALVDYAAVEAWLDHDAGEQSLADLATDAIDRARSRWPDLEVGLEADSTIAAVDPELVVRAIGNLIDNAVVHGAPPVTVTVRDGAITVLDSGTGLQGIDAARAFEPFATGRDGTGLGLAFVAHVARAYGGVATIDDSHAGTRVVIDLGRRTSTLG